MIDPYPSRLLDRFVLRLPDGMRARIAESAKANKRSMNAEIVGRLERSFEALLPPADRGAALATARETGRAMGAELVRRLMPLTDQSKLRETAVALLATFGDKNFWVEVSGEAPQQGSALHGAPHTISVQGLPEDDVARVEAFVRALRGTSGDGETAEEDTPVKAPRRQTRPKL